MKISRKKLYTFSSVSRFRSSAIVVALAALLPLLLAAAEAESFTSIPLDANRDVLVFPSSGNIQWEALHFLTNRVRNIVIQDEPIQAAFLSVLAASTNSPLDQKNIPFACVVLPPENLSKRITVQFRDVPLGLALQIVADISDYKLTILQSQVLLLFEPDRADIMCLRVRYMPVSIIQQITQVSPDKITDLGAWFKEKGIRMPSGAEALFHPQINCISLKNYQHELALMEASLTLEERHIHSISGAGIEIGDKDKKQINNE